MGPSKNQQLFILLFLIVLILSAFFRFYDLDLRPVHHDEGHNAMWALAIKVTEGIPFPLGAGGRHGPLPHFLNVFAFFLLGDNDTSLRFFASLFGAGLLVLLYPLRILLNDSGTFGSAFFLGISPLMIYFSRFAINEIFLVFFTLITAFALYCWILAGKQNYFILTTAAVALLIATKETWIINLLPLFMALTVTYYLHRRELPSLKTSFSLTPKTFWTGVILFLLLVITFYTAFFTKLQNLVYLYRYMAFWIAEGIGGGGHTHPFFTYLINLYWWEWPLLLGAALSIILWLKFRDPVGTYLVFWALFTLLAYSTIDYKTPWLIINILMPLGLLAGRSIKYLMDASFLRSKRILLFVGFFLLCGFFLNLWKTLELNYQRYDDPQLWVVYGQEPRHIKKLYHQIYKIVQAQNDPKAAAIDIMLGFYEKSPSNWYLRRFPGKIFFDNPSEMNRATLLLFSDSTREQVIPRLKPDDYESGRIFSYPGLVYHLWVKKEAWEQFKKKSQLAKK